MCLPRRQHFNWSRELANIEKDLNRLSILTIVTVGFVTIAMGLGGERIWQAGCSAGEAT